MTSACACGWWPAEPAGSCPATTREPLREASFLIEVSRSDIAFERDFPSTPLKGTYDSRLLAQAFGKGGKVVA